MLCLATHAGFAPTLPADRDGVHFADGVDDYDLTRDRPHWPGYPVYIGVAKLVALLTGDAFDALRVLSLVATAATVFPLARLAAELARRRGVSNADAVGVAAAAIWVALPASWLDGSEMYSDPLGLLLMTSALASGRRPLIAGALGGLAIGARPDMLLLGGPLLLLGRRAVLGGALACGAWAGWMILVTGPRTWLEAAWTMLSGHFGEWGGAATTDTAPWERPLRWLGAMARYELGTWWPGLSAARWPATLLLLPALLRGLRGPGLAAFALAFAPYVVFQLVVHPVEVSRYSLPLTAAAVILIANGLPARRLGLATAAVVVAALLVSVPLAVRHADFVTLGIQEVRAAEASAADPLMIRLRSSPFRARFAPGLEEVLLEPGTARAEVERLGATRTLVATRDTLLALGLPPTGWSSLTSVTADPEIHSRSPWVTHLYIRRVPEIQTPGSSVLR